MSGSSAEGGYLRPIGVPPPEADALADIIQGLFQGITGLDPSLVRPRWQAKPPTQPAPDVNWCSVGIVQQTGVDFPYIEYLLGEEEITTLQRQEGIEVLASFYGPLAGAYAAQARDGLYWDQNIAQLKQYNIHLSGADPIMAVPDLVNTQFIAHYDMRVRLSRQVNRQYDIKSILHVVGTIHTDSSGLADTVLEVPFAVHPEE